MHICISNLTIIGPDNGFSPGQPQAIIWTNMGLLLITPLGTNFREILIGIHIYSFQKMHLKMSSRKWWPFCLGFHELKNTLHWTQQCTDYYGTSIRFSIYKSHPNPHNSPSWVTYGVFIVSTLEKIWFLFNNAKTSPGTILTAQNRCFIQMFGRDQLFQIFFF